MIASIKRQIALYFNNKASVFFSLMGAWIAFALYVIFLQKNMLLFKKRKIPCYNARLVGSVAQLVEQRIENPRVGGSIPPQATSQSPHGQGKARY